MAWEKTNTHQWVNRINDTTYQVVDILVMEREIRKKTKCDFILKAVECNISDYSKPEIEEIIKAYGYSTIESATNMFGEGLNKFIAICIVKEDVGNQEIVRDIEGIENCLMETMDMSLLEEEIIELKKKTKDDIDDDVSIRVCDQEKRDIGRWIQKKRIEDPVFATFFETCVQEFFAEKSY